ncbi:hypothetical protein VB005_02471 [Metarhizium brunneum]
MENHSQDGGSPSHSAQMLVQMMSQLTESVQALRNERDNDREETRTQIQALQSAIATPNHTASEDLVNPTPQRLGPVPPVPNTASPPIILQQIHQAKKRATLPDPPRFEGNRLGFRAWLSEIRNKLRVDGPAIGSRPDQFAYIYARLGGQPQSMTIAYVEAGGNDGMSDPDRYLQYLEECYGDPNAKARAIERLRSLRQKDQETFAAFLPKFERELADSGGSAWPEEVKISYLEASINSQLRHASVYTDLDRTRYPAWVQTLQKISSRLEGIRKAGVSRPNGKSDSNYFRSQGSNAREGGQAEQQRDPTSEAAASNQMDWEPTKVGKAGSKKSSGYEPGLALKR